MTESAFLASVGLAAVLGVLAIPSYYLLQKWLKVDFKVMFYTELAEAVGFWYARKERKQQLESAPDR